MNKHIDEFYEPSRAFLVQLSKKLAMDAVTNKYILSDNVVTYVAGYLKDTYAAGVDAVHSAPRIGG